MKKDRIIQQIDTREEKLLSKMIKEKNKINKNIDNLYLKSNNKLISEEFKIRENLKYIEQLDNINLSLLDNELDHIVKLMEKMIRVFIRKGTFQFYDKNGTNRCTKVMQYLQTLKNYYIQYEDKSDVSERIRIIDSYINEMRVILKYMDLVYQKTVSIVDAVAELIEQIPKLCEEEIEIVLKEDKNSKK